MGDLLRSVGVRGRLLLAFVCICAFAILAALAALTAFSKVDSVVERITQERVPAGFAALELARQAERLTTAAPLLLTTATLPEQLRMDRQIRNELRKLETLFE